MKTFKVIYAKNTKGTETVEITIKADEFRLSKEKGYRYYKFYDNGENYKAVFTATNVIAIYEV